MTFKSLVTAIADAIREKGGTTEKIRGRDIPDAIRNIKAGLPSEDYVLYTQMHSNGGLGFVIVHGDLEKIKATGGYGGASHRTVPTHVGASSYIDNFLIQFEKVKKIPSLFYGSNSYSSYGDTYRMHFLDDEIEEFGEKAFKYSKIKEFWPAGYTRNAIPKSITIIPKECFQGANLTTPLELHDDITRIDDYAFANNHKISNGELPANLEYIGAYGLGENRIPFTKIPASVKHIGDYAFYYNSVIGSVTFLGKPDTLSSKAFQDCSNLTDIYVPWAEGEVAGAPWCNYNPTIHYNHKEG